MNINRSSFGEGLAADNAEETSQEHEVAEALFDLANMFAAAGPVLEAEEAATSSPPAPRHDSGHRAKRARGAKGRGGAAAAAVQSYQQSTRAEGRFGRGGSGHAATAAAPGPSFQEALARQPQADAAIAHDYGMVAAQLAAGRGGEWDRHGSANGLVGLAGKGSLVNGVGGGFAAPNGLPAGLAGFYQPGALPQGLGAGGGWPGGPADERGAPEGQMPSGFGGDHRFPRCASHVYIAHFIEYQSKLERQRQATGMPPMSAKYEGFYRPGAAPPPGFPGPQQNGSAQQQQQHDDHGQGGGASVKLEQGEQQSQPQQQGGGLDTNGSRGNLQLPMSAGLPFGALQGAAMPMGSSGPMRGGHLGMPPAAALQQQQQQYAAQLSQLAMLSQQSGGAFPPFLPPPGAPPPPQMSAGGFAGGGGMTPQQQAAAAAAAPFFSQQGFSLASLLPPAAIAHLATSAGMQPDLKGLPGGLDGLVTRSPSAARLDELQGGLPQNATRAEIEAWAAKNLGGQQHGGGGANGGQQGQLQSQHGSGGGNGYQLAEAQLKQFQEAFANAERERKLRTAGLLDGRSMPPNIIDAHAPAGGGTRIVLH